MLQLIENEIHYCALPVGELLDIISGRKELRELDFVSSCAEIYESGVSFSEAWCSGVKGSACGLNADDKQLLYSFGDALGTTDVSGQISLCRLHAHLLEERLEQARREKDKKGKVCTSLGALAGVFFAVVLA